MRYQEQTQWFRNILTRKLAAWAPITLLCLTVTPQVAAQSPEHERHYRPFQDRLAAGEVC